MGMYNGIGDDIDPVLGGFREAGYLIEILHISSGKKAEFPSWITDFSDSYTSNWDSQTIFGRSDPIGTYQGTTRVISVSLSIPSYSVIEARENLHQLEHLIANLYPSYKKSANGTLTMVGSPMVKVRFGNLIKNADQKINAAPVESVGLSGWINNVNFTPNLESGFHHPTPSMSEADILAYNGHHAITTGTKNKSHTFIPKVLDFSFTLNVVHEHSLGWQGQTWLNKSDQFPYGMETISGGVHAAGSSKKAVSKVQKKAQQAAVKNVLK